MKRLFGCYSMVWIALAIIACGLSSARAQLIIPETSVDTQRLPEEAQQKLMGLDSIITAYFADATQPWNRDDFGYDLPIQINVYVTDYTSNPQEDKYKANLIITNKKETRFDDKRLEFGLRTPVVVPRGQYHPFFSVIEFYVWMLIGVEEDKQEKFGGRPFFDKARQVFLQSSGSIFYYGWDKRSDLLRDYTDDKNNTARELNFYYFTGVYYDSLNDYGNSASYLYWALIKLKDLPFNDQKAFLDAHNQEFANALNRSFIPEDKRESLRATLIQLDPEHRSIYQTISVPEKAEEP